MTQSKCSRAGCQNQADFLIFWRNPKVHSPERRKTWGACHEHREFLVDYLGARNFYLEDQKVEPEHP
ncbi:MAG: acetone carboxylase [Aquiluna sp.]|nr:acetone carboxylase [Aquiluna sp.]